MLQRQDGYLIALRDVAGAMEDSEGADNGQVLEAEVLETADK